MHKLLVGAYPSVHYRVVFGFLGFGIKEFHSMSRNENTNTLHLYCHLLSFSAE